MLSERKKAKTKIGEDPNNLNWALDDSNYGARMLGKMGWNRGSGMGRREDGPVENITSAIRSDNRGIGLTLNETNNRDSLWTESAREYDEILKSLKPLQDQDKNRGKRNKKKTKSSKNIKSGDDGSKKVEKTTHRSKFIKNKRVTAYSEEALRQILGK